MGIMFLSLCIEISCGPTCPSVMQVQVHDMPSDAKSKYQAVTRALVAAAVQLPDIDCGPLRLLGREGATFGRMIYAIQSQLSTPLIVAFDGMQVTLISPMPL